MENLRQSVGLRSYGQKDPLVEYKGEAYKYFEELMQNVRLQICTGMFRSASNVQVFENMLALLAKGARAQGPTGVVAPLPIAAPPMPAPKIEMPRVTAQVRTMITTSGRRQEPKGDEKK
jgi:preprotein translocase subunit SecA